MGAFRTAAILLNLGLLITGCQTPSTTPTASHGSHARVEIVGEITANAIPEASGMASSLIRKDLLWIVNDSGNPSALHAIDTTGAYLGSVRVEGVDNRDWEDLAAFRLGGTAYLLIADIGDNAAKQDHYTLSIVEEPSTGDSAAIAGSVRPTGTVRFQYPDGAKDGESVAVVPELNRVYILTKRTTPPVLYCVDLIPPPGRTLLMAERVTEVTGLIKPDSGMLPGISENWPFRNQPTAMDIDPRGRRAIVLTYSDAFLFTKKPWETWMNAFSGTPEAMGLPRLPQGEAICFSFDGRSVFVTTENLPAPLLRIDVPR
ncbi:MAG: hypothetical protein PVH30_04445 [Desulfobacterales bacterium]|jgi:hypothetical protein